MRNISPSVPGSRPVVDIANATLSRGRWESEACAEETQYEKWPVWARLITIVSLSALLWGGIISALIALFS